MNSLMDLLMIQKYQITALNDPHAPPITICSGRSAGYVEAMLANLGFPPVGKYAVVENGACIMDFRANIEKTNPAIGINTSVIMDGLLQKIIPPFMAEIGGKIEPGKKYCISLDPPSGMEIRELYKLTKEKLSQFENFIELTYSGSAVDITPKGVNKGSGFEFLARESGSYPENILYIGDSVGDIPALNLAGFAACPNNATLECRMAVRDKNGYLSGFDDTRGVIDILKHFENYF